MNILVPAAGKLREHAEAIKSDSAARLRKLILADGAAYLNVDHVNSTFRGGMYPAADQIYRGPYGFENARDDVRDNDNGSVKFNYAGTIELRPDGTWRIHDLSEG